MTRTYIYMKEAADRVMIADLVARYVWALDYGTPEEWANVFTPDGILRGAPMACRALSGASTWWSLPLI